MIFANLLITASPLSYMCCLTPPSPWQVSVFCIRLSIHMPSSVCRGTVPIYYSLSCYLLNCCCGKRESRRQSYLVVYSQHFVEKFYSHISLSTRNARLLVFVASLWPDKLTALNNKKEKILSLIVQRNTNSRCWLLWIELIRYSSSTGTVWFSSETRCTVQCAFRIIRNILQTFPHMREQMLLNLSGRQGKSYFLCKFLKNYLERFESWL